jgi:hypothetical protein
VDPQVARGMQAGGQHSPTQVVASTRIGASW